MTVFEFRSGGPWVSEEAYGGMRFRTCYLVKIDLRSGLNAFRHIRARVDLGGPDTLQIAEVKKLVVWIRLQASQVCRQYDPRKRETKRLSQQCEGFRVVHRARNLKRCRSLLRGGHEPKTDAAC